MSEQSRRYTMKTVRGPKTAAQRKECKQLFIDALKKNPNVSAACDMAGIGRQTVYKWRDHDKTFAQAWDDAIEYTRDTARSSIYMRGILGWDEPVVAQGRVVYDMVPALDEHGEQIYDDDGVPQMKCGERLLMHKWSDSLASLYAKANLPEYKDKAQVNINAQLSDLAENAKQSLLADLAAQMTDEMNDDSSQTTTD